MSVSRGSPPKWPVHSPQLLLRFRSLDKGLHWPRIMFFTVGTPFTRRWEDAIFSRQNTSFWRELDFSWCKGSDPFRIMGEHHNLVLFLKMVLFMKRFWQKIPFGQRVQFGPAHVFGGHHYELVGIQVWTLFDGDIVCNDWGGVVTGSAVTQVSQGRPEESGSDRPERES